MENVDLDFQDLVEKNPLKNQVGTNKIYCLIESRFFATDIQRQNKLKT